MQRHSALIPPTMRPDAAVSTARLALRDRAAWLSPTRWRCLLVGHDDQLAREPLRLFLRCGACGRCTRGWAIGTNPPLVTAALAKRPRRPTVGRAAAMLVPARFSENPSGSVLFGTARHSARA